MKRGKYLIKNTIIFSLGNLGTKFITFFLLPLYTAYLSTEQYGTVDLITTIVMVAVPILFLNIGESVMRFSLDKNADIDGIMSIGLVAILFSIIPGIVMALCLHFYDPIADYSIYILLYSLTMGCSQVFLCYLRGREMLIKYSIGNIVQTLIIALLNILSLVILKKGITGYLTSYIIAYIIVTIYCIAVSDVNKVFRHIRLNKNLAKEMLKYSLVLIPNSFMWWIMNSSDRIMVSSMISVAANGLYAVSYKLPTLVSTVTSVFNQAWSYSAIREEGAIDEVEYNNNVFKMMSYAVLLIGILIICISKFFLKIYISADFYDAWKYIPFLTIGCVYLALGTFVGTSYTVHKDSFGFLLSSMTGALLNIVLNFLLIPIIDVYGAAIATCFSYIVVFLFRVFHTKKYIRYKILSKEFILGSCAIITVSILIFFDNICSYASQIIIVILYMLIGKNIWRPFFNRIHNSIVKKETRNGK